MAEQPSTSESEPLLHDEPLASSRERSAEDLQELRDALVEAVQHLVHLLAAVSCCMSFVVACITLSPSVARHDGVYFPYAPLPEPRGTVIQRTANSIANALAFIAFIALMTCFMVTLFYYRCYGVVRAWVILASWLILWGSSLTVLESILRTINLPVDIITVIVAAWNFSAVGLVSIFADGPLLLQQSYLIVESGLMALTFVKDIPDWTLWFVLSFVPVWDLVAVLCVLGPLRILIQMLTERGEGITPGLFFSTGTSKGLWKPSKFRKTSLEKTGVPSPEDSVDGDLDVISERAEGETSGRVLKSGDRQERSPLLSPGDRREGHLGSDGVRMGLGDFVFYSVLLGKVATFGDWNLITACFVAILVGICVTTALLFLSGAALPALPVSLGLGLIFVGFSEQIEGFADVLTEGQVYI